MNFERQQKIKKTNHQTKRRVTPFLFVTAACLIVSACLPNPRDRIYTVQIADETFRVPREYFHRFLPDPEEESLYFAVLYPEFEPLKKSRSKYWHEGRGDYVITFIVSSAENHLPLDGVIERSKMTFAGDYFAGNHFGMAKWTRHPNEDQHSEFFIYEEGGKQVGYIICRIKAGALVNPNCSGTFRKYGVSIRISFDKDHLDQWPDIRDRSFALIDGFRVKD